MSSRSVVGFLMLAILAFASLVTANERNVGSCIRNCVQCMNMFGDFFMVDECLKSCYKHKGKFIPDCEDEISIKPFLRRLSTAPLYDGDY